ncbi:MAG: hypothetical protein H7232_02730 [Aeromicrobium sp.]|nr:hypothetical protein [Burkholderiales bacterium]
MAKNRRQGRQPPLAGTSARQRILRNESFHDLALLAPVEEKELAEAATTPTEARACFARQHVAAGRGEVDP